MICLKNLDVLNIDIILQEIYFDTCQVFNLKTVTSAYRHKDKGVHGTQPVRGLDLRCRSDKRGEEICNYINSRWQYDPQRPDMNVAIYHNIGHGPHIHLQSYPRTKKYGM